MCIEDIYPAVHTHETTSRSFTCIRPISPHTTKIACNQSFWLYFGLALLITTKDYIINWTIILLKFENLE